MAVSAVISSILAVTETIATTAPAPNTTTAQTINYLDGAAQTINAGSGVPATKVAKFRQLMTAGAATIDLTSLTDVLKGAMSLSGLKVQALKVTALSTNANTVTIGEGASNGYELAGNAWSLILQPGQSVLFFGNEAAPDVGSGAKTIDLAGTGTQGVDITIVAG